MFEIWQTYVVFCIWSYISWILFTGADRLYCRSMIFLNENIWGFATSRRHGVFRRVPPPPLPWIFGRGIFGEVHWYPSISGRMCVHLRANMFEERDPRERESCKSSHAADDCALRGRCSSGKHRVNITLVRRRCQSFSCLVSSCRYYRQDLLYSDWSFDRFSYFSYFVYLRYHRSKSCEICRCVLVWIHQGPSS